MNPYHKINSIFKRAERGEMLMGQFADPEVEYLAANDWMFTEKVDGTNIRLQWDGTAIKVCGKSDNAQIPPFLLDAIAEIITPAAMAQQFGTVPACLYGEGYGARIQKGGGNYIPDGVSFVLFDVRIGDFWLQRVDVADVSLGLNISVVPVLTTGPLMTMVDMVKDGFKSMWGTARGEGIVARPGVELRTRRGDRIITKLKTKDFERAIRSEA